MASADKKNRVATTLPLATVGSMRGRALLQPERARLVQQGRKNERSATTPDTRDAGAVSGVVTRSVRGATGVKVWHPRRRSGDTLSHPERRKGARCGVT